MFTLTAAKPALDRVHHTACRTAVEVGWRLAEGAASANDVAVTLEGLRAAWEEGLESAIHYYEAPPELWALPRLVNVLTLLFNEPAEAARQLLVPLSIVHPGQPVPLLTPEETRNCCWLVRELFNRGGVGPLLPWENAWQTETAVALAAQIYASGEFSAMPILADALQDVGCDNVDALIHCRGPGPHVRGCWVVDLVLGKGMNRPPNPV
ncbi:hypothetical protein [Fimbriiglobus ruber]|uniref:SMI1/KNR4 family protein n=1 Tax=Fimbriiglobus ruber TaxID=1908690 RepID=A0A225DEX8_9BACT|nr:hypothetical protein [Fimbriiglobus ruber]OWK38204.1 hypothetical protein FRUB_07324 [Fimbriiglobus ruber]